MLFFRFSSGCLLFVLVAFRLCGRLQLLFDVEAGRGRYLFWCVWLMFWVAVGEAETGVKEGGELVCIERILAPETDQIGKPVFCHVKVGRQGGASVLCAFVTHLPCWPEVGLP